VEKEDIGVCDEDEEMDEKEEDDEEEEGPTLEGGTKPGETPCCCPWRCCNLR
jgi:hypothetical protein